MPWAKTAFPGLPGKLDEKTQQPKLVMLVGGGLISLILLTCDLKFIAKAANFSLLVSVLPVSLAMRKIYKKNPASKPKRKSYACRRSLMY